MTRIDEKGGATALSRFSLIRAIRRLEQYEEWKRAVFIRDRFSCQRCGRRNGRKRVIEAHHLTELAVLAKQYGITTLEGALNCPRLWDVSNGQTLCKACHQQTESYPINFRSTDKN